LKVAYIFGCRSTQVWLPQQVYIKCRICERKENWPKELN